MNFRSDINGLRAIAVLSVLFYHFGVSGFNGGYVGVDVFFVISGFLMTKIIYTKVQKDKFTLVGFYADRARRIFPAVIALTTILMGLGMFFLTGLDYKLISRETFSTLLFYSNIFFSHKGDYFDPTFHVKWLLHTWSLSVEWQFYLLFPVIIMWLHKFKEGLFLKRGVIGLFVFSLLLGVGITPFHPVEAFFLLPTRGWELLAGSLVFFFGSRISRTPYLVEAGLACIFVSVFFYTSDFAFPGFWAILPVLGGALIVAAQKESIIFSNKPAQFIGNISYSLYLWHWPVIVGAKYLEFPFTPVNILLLFGTAVLLSTLSYYFIEAPFRDMKKSVSDIRFLSVGTYTCVVLAILFYGVFQKDGLPSRLPEDVRAAEAENRNAVMLREDCQFEYKKRKGLPECVIGAKTTPTVVIWGDSHASAAANAVSDVLEAQKRATLLYSYAGCPPVLGSIFIDKWKSNKCKDINQVTYDAILSNPRLKDVILIGRWPVYLRGYTEKGSGAPYIVFDLKMRATKETFNERARQYSQKIVETMCGLTAHGKRVYVMGTVPEFGLHVPMKLAKSRLLHHRDTSIEIPLSRYNERNKEILEAFAQAKKQCNVHILDPRHYICDATTCFGIRNGKPLYFDDNHLSVAGNGIIKPLFEKAFH